MLLTGSANGSVRGNEIKDDLEVGNFLPTSFFMFESDFSAAKPVDR